MFGFFARIHYDPTTQLTYGDFGEIIDAQGTRASSFAGAPLFNCVMAPDGPHGKAFFGCTEGVQSTTTSLVIHSFDLATRSRIDTVLLSSWPSSMADNAESVRRLVRWGPNGLALATTAAISSKGGNIYLYSGPLVH